MNEETINPTHSFEVSEAIRLGSIEKALIMKEIRRMSLYRIRVGKDPFVYYSSSALSKKFPYMNKRTLERWLNQLVDDKELVSTLKNKVKYDRTLSYTTPQLSKSVPQNAESIPLDGSPIPPLSYPLSVEATSEIENSISQEGSLSQRRSEDTAALTVVPVDDDGFPVKQKIKKVLVKDDRIEKVISEWNKYPIASVLNKGRVPNKLSESELLPKAESNPILVKRIKDNLRFFPEMSYWEKAIKKYVEDIINRQPTETYARHRMSLYDFVNQKNGLLKFVNK